MRPLKDLKREQNNTNETAGSHDSMRCATANVLREIRRGEGGVEVRMGTKHFRGGAKVYIIDYYPGTCESVVVVGHHRASGRYIELAMRAKHLENFRITTVYSPKVLSIIRERYSKYNFPYSEGYAQHICDAATDWAETERIRNELRYDGNSASQGNPS